MVFFICSFSFGQASRQQCCYDEIGNLFFNSGGGTADLFAPIDAKSTLNHIFEDLIPYIYCCVPPVSNCMKYNTYRPLNNGIGYTPPIPGMKHVYDNQFLLFMN